MAKDPVCSMEVNDKSPIKSFYNSKLYVFCSQSCKQMFDKEPKRFAR